MLQSLVLSAVVTANLMGLNVKVLAVDHKERQITVLLPVHHAKLQAALVPGEKEIRVLVNEYYEAEIEPGQVDTTKRSLLRIKIPDERPVTFRLRKITFLGH